MHVEHLLGDTSLGLRLLWAQDALLRREISGVTVTDLEDPARFVRPGEVVLSGLVWWSPEGGSGKAERFVSALKEAGAAALLAGEETHGSVPDDLVEACVRHGLPVAGVPAHIMFRAITDAVYLRQWGALGRHHALPENARVRISRLLAQDSGPGPVLEAAFAHLDAVTAYVFTPSGRTVAATPGAPVIAVPEAAALVADGSGVTVSVASAAASPYERWLLYLPDLDGAPPRMLHEIAVALGNCQDALARGRTAGRQAADELGALLFAPEARPAAVEAALRRCGQGESGPVEGWPAEGASYRVVVAGAGAAGALEEVAAQVAQVAQVAQDGAGRAIVGRLPDGCAFAVLPGALDGGLDGALDEVWSRVAACAPGVPLHGGTGAPAVGAEGLDGALAQARYALTSARTTAPDASRLTDATTLAGLHTLLTGIPADVRAAYARTVLGELLESDRAATAVLLSTLETFLACDGSWARTARALHLHVNTVHYRIERVEHFTGRDLSRLRDRLDLWAALLCR
ncbi:helix-turn-helix domain-containing protein [Streptomyces sp. NPDC048297]|uniref:helix-turn-helix domain-containing protein n=1 Tax=Streptomyces sp. NPDC048297 TaxID=3365531 RepID=UPI00371C3B28